jgi:hypothetical protein
VKHAAYGQKLTGNSNMKAVGMEQWVDFFPFTVVIEREVILLNSF